MCARVSQLYEKDHSESTIGRVAMVKEECIRNCKEVCSMARETMGDEGVILEKQAIKALCDIEAIQADEGSKTLKLVVAAKEMAEIAAFKL